MIGKTISHYRIIEQPGARGMGIVYKAEDTRLHRFIAINQLLFSPLAVVVPTSEHVRVAVRRIP